MPSGRRRKERKREERESERERHATTVKDTKYILTNEQQVRLKYRGGQTETGKAAACASVSGPGHSCTHRHRKDKCLAQHTARSCPLTEWGSNRAFCLGHKDAANV